MRLFVTIACIATAAVANQTGTNANAAEIQTINHYMTLAQTATSVEEKEKWLGLLAKFAPSAAIKLARNNVMGYMSSALESTVAQEKAKQFSEAIIAAKSGQSLFKATLPTQSSEDDKARAKWWDATIRAAQLGYDTYKTTSLSQTSATKAGTIKSRIGKLLKKSSPKQRKAVKAAFNLVKHCKALWKGVRPKCLNSTRCATTIITQCLNKKACRVGAIKKIHQCAVREGMAAVKKACKGKKGKALAKCSARKAARNLSRFTAAGALVLQFGARVIRSEVKRTCKGKAKCMKTANARINQIWKKVQREAKRVVKGKMLAQTSEEFPFCLGMPWSLMAGSVC